MRQLGQLEMRQSRLSTSPPSCLMRVFRTVAATMHLARAVDRRPPVKCPGAAQWIDTGGLALGFLTVDTQLARQSLKLLEPFIALVMNIGDLAF